MEKKKLYQEVAEFLERTYEQGLHFTARTLRSDAYRRYRAFMAGRDEEPLTKGEFFAELRYNGGFRIERIGGQWWILGLRLKDDDTAWIRRGYADRAEKEG